MSAKVPGADLRILRERLDTDSAFGWRRQILALLNHIDAVETERSAAPEMLTLLKKIYDTGYGMREHTETEALIAKAEGRQP